MSEDRLTWMIRTGCSIEAYVSAFSGARFEKRHEVRKRRDQKGQLHYININASRFRGVNSSRRGVYCFPVCYELGPMSQSTCSIMKLGRDGLYIVYHVWIAPLIHSFQKTKAMKDRQKSYWPKEKLYKFKGSMFERL